jgi:hypothetical protein
MARYKLMGYEIVGREVNEVQMSEAEQRPQGLKEVYETDDVREAQAILTAGGFFRDRDNFITVSAIVDGDLAVPVQPMPRRP